MKSGTKQRERINWWAERHIPIVALHGFCECICFQSSMLMEHLFIIKKGDNEMKIEIYSIPNCPYCVKAKILLQSQRT